MTKTSHAPRSKGLPVAVVKLLAGNVVVMGCNVLRDVVVAATLGASVSADYFFLAISIPVYVISVAGGSYRSVVVPFLVGKADSAQGSTNSAATRLTWLNVLGVVWVSGLSAAVLASAYLVARGSAASSANAPLLRAMLMVIPMYAFSAFVEMSQGVLQAVGALVGPNLSRAALPAGIVLGVGLLGAGSGILGLILGGTLGAMVGALVVAWQLPRHGMRIAEGARGYRRRSTAFPAESPRARSCDVDNALDTPH